MENQFMLVKPGSMLTIYYAGTQDTRNIAWAKNPEDATEFPNVSAASSARRMLGNCIVTKVK